LSMTWRDIVRRAGPLVALLVAAVLGLVVSGLFNGPAPAVSASWTEWLNTGLENYAATAGQWNSGDNAVQVALPGDRALWLFNDSYYGPVRADGTVSPGSPLVRNMMLMSSGSGSSFKVTDTITGAISNGVPAPAVPPVAGSPAGSWAWPDGGIVAGQSVEAIYTVFAQRGPGPLDYVPVANQVVIMPLASLTEPSSYVIQPASFGQASLTAGCGFSGVGCVQWGIGLLNAAPCPPQTFLSACTYIYGEVWPAPGDSRRTLVVAVAPRGALADPSTWWYDTTVGWSKSLPAPAGGNAAAAAAGLAAPLGRGTHFSAGSVYKIPGGDYLVLGSGRGGIIAYYAHDPWLSGARPVRLFSAPRSHGVPGFIAYQFHIEPAYSRGRRAVIGFSVTSFDHDANCLNYAPFYDVSAYQPRFYSVTLPASASAGAGAGAGAGASASADAADPQELPPPRLRQFRPRNRPLPSGRSWSSGTCLTP
jgi:hypothetical protein